MCLFAVRNEEFHQLFRSFERQIDTADHEKRHDEGRREIAENERQRQQEDELVAQRSLGDLPDDRQFAFRLQPHDIFRGDGRVVDDDARRLGAGLCRLSCDIVERGCRHLRNGCDIIEKCEQAGCHGKPFCVGLAVAKRSKGAASRWKSRLPATVSETDTICVASSIFQVP